MRISCKDEGELVTKHHGKLAAPSESSRKARYRVEPGPDGLVHNTLKGRA